MGGTIESRYHEATAYFVLSKRKKMKSKPKWRTRTKKTKLMRSTMQKETKLICVRRMKIARAKSVRITWHESTTVTPRRKGATTFRRHLKGQQHAQELAFMKNREKIGAIATIARTSQQMERPIDTRNHT